ncbi:choice-of-anchor I family protein [Microbacterium soli]|uniref:Bifunctional metallophosphatase/5'-nucleotidase n=1 Tax=Microbacterium soli TaxID=446075 RepID=A0ABP7NCL6_9MICO
MPFPHSRRAARAVSATALTCAVVLAPLTAVSVAAAAVVPEPISHSADGAALALTPIGTFETGQFDKAGAEIVHAYKDRLFVVDAEAGAVTVLDFSDPTAPVEVATLAVSGHVANSVAIRPSDGLGVVALEAPVKTDPGILVFFDANAEEPAEIGRVSVGALPDNVVISEDGRYAVSADEGEPADDFSIDPEGSISVVALPSTVSAPAQSDVRTADFHAFEEGGSKTLREGVRVFGPTPHDDLPVSRNLEPEFIAIDGGTAYAALQEANAIATVDLATASVTDILPLGYKDNGLDGNGFDASDEDGVIDIRTHPGVRSLYMPDGLEAYRTGGATYLVSANEGDAREWGDYADVERIKNFGDAEDRPDLAPVCDTSTVATSDPDFAEDEHLGRLNALTDVGLNDDGTCYESLYVGGTRSFSIWSTNGDLVYDSGDDFERITAAAAPEYFNSNHSESGLDGRSDDKGPEPENLTIGAIGDRTYAFIGLERVGGIMVYDITDPASSEYVTYVNNRDFSISVEDADDPEAVLSGAGDLGPEGLEFIPAESSPTGEPLLAVANEVSGTTTLFRIADAAASATTDIQVLTINDFHGRIEQNLGGGEAGAAVLAGAVDALESENPNTLFVSAGDNIGASTFTSFIAEDQPTIDALAAAGLDVSTVGNHEFDRGFDDLTDRVLPGYGGTQFGLGANVYLKGTDEPALDEYRIETIDGVRVAFIGTVTASTAAMVTPTGIADIEFGDQLEAANRVADELTASDAADVIILLAHTGAAESSCDAVLADDTDFGALVHQASAEIDAIVSAHTHQKYDCMVAGPTGVERPVIQAFQYGTNLGRLDISVDRATGDLVSIEGDVIPLVVDGRPAFPADPAVEQIVAAATDAADEAGNVEVGSISADILRGGTPAGADRGVESTLGNTVADVYLWATSNENYAGTPAQIAIMNPGGLRDDLLYGQDGTLTYRQVANVQPFANTLVTVELTGTQLKSILEEQWQPEGSERPKLHLGISEGFSYEYDPDAAKGSHILSMSYQGEEIAADDVFTVATNSFLAAGGDNFVAFAEGTQRTDTGQVDLIATVDYFAAHAVVDPAPLGRAVVATEAGQPGGGQGGEGEPGQGEGGEAGSGDGQGDGLALTGAELPWGIALLAAILLVVGGGLYATRRRGTGTV